MHGDSTTDCMETLKGLIKDYYEQIHQTNSLKESTCQNSTRRNRQYEYILYIKEIKSIVNNLSKRKATGSDGLTCEFYQTLKEKL